MSLGAAALAIALSTPTTARAQAPESGPRERIAPPALAARLGLMPLVSTNVPGFRTAYPQADGRGVVIGILDSGIDPTIPGLLATTTGEPKILDLRDFSGEGRIALSRLSPAGDVVRIGDATLTGFDAIRARSGEGPWFGGVLRERPLGEMPAADLNGDGDDEDALPVLVARVDGEWMVAVDRDGDGSLAGEPLIRDYLRARETFGWSTNGEKSPLALAVNLADAPGTDQPVLDLHFDTSAHGSHVAGIAAGRDIYGVAGFDGVAPGAWLLGLKISDNAQGGITTSGSMLRAMDYAIRFARTRSLPLVLNMSFGVGNEREGRARIDMLVDSVLAANPDVVFTISAGNDGPGLSTLGFPGSASRAIGVGATISPVFRPGAEGPGMMQEPVASFSARGGELAKPDIVTPGVIYSTVPQWNTGDEVKGGTSMASPFAAGLVARLVSGLVQQGRTIDAARIRLALEATARNVPGAETPDQGAGRPDLLAAMRWLSEPHEVEPLRVRLDGVDGATALLRRGAALASDSTVTFVVSRETGGIARRLLLRGGAPWLSAPEEVTLDGTEVRVPVVLRAGTSGSVTATIRLFAANDTTAGPLARLTVTMLGDAPVDAEARLAAGIHGTARVAVPIEAGRATVIRVDAIGSPNGADLSFHEPDGRPWRDGRSTPLGADSGAVFAVDGRDAEAGRYELVLLGSDPGPAEATVRVLPSPMVPMNVTRTGATVAVAWKNVDRTAVTLIPEAAVVGAERSIAVESRSGNPRRLPLKLPIWVRRITVDVEMPRVQWSRFTDFGVTLFDDAGRQLGKEPMNYPGARLVVGELPDPAAGREVVLGLFPGLADPADEATWSVSIAVRFYGDSLVPMKGAGPRLALAPEKAALWRYTLPAGALTPLPDGAAPLVQYRLERDGDVWTTERALTGAPIAAPRPAPARRRTAGKP
jgi:subtilisin family serine protease